NIACQHKSEPRACALGCILATSNGYRLLHLYRLLQLEAERRLGGQDDVLIAGESRATCTGAATSQCTDYSALTAARQPANQGSQCGAASSQDRCALAFAGCGANH